MNNRFLYIFLDESGNFDFSPKGTKYFLLCSVTKERPFSACKDLIELKYDLAESGEELEYFHASEDTQSTRNAVFRIIQKHIAGVRIDVLVVDKRKVGPALRDVMKFYPRMIGYLLRYILNGVELAAFREVIVFTDRIPISRRREALEKSVKVTLAEMLPKSSRYRVVHHDSKSNYDLQIADYCNWAVYRKWDRQDLRHYNLISTAIRSEFDIFRTGTRLYY